jgi:hypothetical protein
VLLAARVVRPISKSSTPAMIAGPRFRRCATSVLWFILATELFDARSGKFIPELERLFIGFNVETLNR